MTTIHIALFKWKTGTSDVEVDRALQMVRNLKNKIPGLVEIKCGQNYHKASLGFTHGVLVIGENQAALSKYRAHPDHDTVAALIESMELDGLGFDFDD